MSPTLEVQRIIEKSGGVIAPSNRSNSASTGFRIGHFRSYSYGSSNPNLRPVVTD